MILERLKLASSYRAPSRKHLSPALLCLWLAFLAQPSVAGSKTIQCEGIRQRYIFFHPKDAPDTQAKLPAVLLLHGAGDIPENMIDAWKKFAKTNGIILLAPELPRDPKFEDSAPKIFHCVVEDARQSFPIDPARIYVFGNSMGGYLAFDAAMFESQYFAAVAVHGMKIADDYKWIVDRAKRKTPIVIYIGDHDQFHSAESVQNTRDLLRTAGITNRLAEDTDVLNDQSVITTKAAADELPDRFIEEFAAALARHRCWERRTDPVPA